MSPSLFSPTTRSLEAQQGHWKLDTLGSTIAVVVMIGMKGDLGVLRLAFMGLTRLRGSKQSEVLANCF